MQPAPDPMMPPAGLLAAMFLRDDFEAKKQAPIELSPLLVAVLAGDDFDDVG